MVGQQDAVDRKSGKEFGESPLVRWERMTDAEIEGRTKQLIEMGIVGPDAESVRESIIFDRKKLVVTGEHADNIIQGIGILLTHVIEAEKRLQDKDFGGSIYTSGDDEGRNGELISVYSREQTPNQREYELVMRSAYDVVKAGLKLTSGIDIPSYLEA